MLRPLAFLAGLMLTAGSLTACGGEAGDDGLPRVVTTVSPITSIVESIGGERIRIDGLVPEGTDSHTFEPPPSVARLLARADLIVLNGLGLEEPSLRLAEANRRDEAAILLLGDRALSPDQWVFDFSFPRSAGQPNPHAWTDPMLALRYAELVEAELSRLDPDGAAYYRENLQAFRSQIEALDAAIREAVQTVPEEHRRLLTYHDSWPYFAQRYGFEVVGAVQPSDFAEPSARDVARLVDQVRELRLPAIFGSEVFPSDVLETIARESGARYVDDLRDDDLPGEPGDPMHSYLGLMTVNMGTMLAALGGETAPFDSIAAPVHDRRANVSYPQ